MTCQQFMEIGRRGPPYSNAEIAAGIRHAVECPDCVKMVDGADMKASDEEMDLVNKRIDDLFEAAETDKELDLPF